MTPRFPFAPLLVALAMAGAAFTAWGNSLPGKSSAVGIVPHAALKTRTVEYRDGDQVLEGYLAYDEAKPGKRPAVLIVHDWKGVGPYVKRRADQLAKLGYLAFAVDIYGKGMRPQTAEAAGALAGVAPGLGAWPPMPIATGEAAPRFVAGAIAATWHA